MAQPQTDTPAPDADAPLDPAVEAVRRRLARLLVVSIGIMLAGVLAVLGAVVYKIRSSDVPPAATGVLAIPAGAQVIDQALGDGVIALRIRDAAGAERLLLFSTADGRQSGDWTIAPLP